MGARHHVHLTEKERIGAYEIRDLRGRGQIASVYECRHTALGRPAAVKLMHGHLAGDSNLKARFLREGRALARVSHPSVVEVFDVGEHHGAPYLVMTLVDGDSLGEHFEQLQPMSVAAVADCVLPIIGGVVAAYDAGIVDRDLTPHNIRISRDHRGAPTPKILDFSISKLTGDESGEKVFQTDGILRAANYVAPEQLCSTSRPHVRSDVYSLGAILYEAATGRPMFEADTAFGLMQAIFAGDFTAPSAVREDISPSFDAIVLRALRREPYERYSSARDLGHALAALASEPGAWASEFAPSSGHRIAARRSSGIQLGKRPRH
ncbi:MAG TPA: serine/threonine-protein kinase [Polyangiaceae bacterium]